MNPQENVLNYLKSKLFRRVSRFIIYELISGVKGIIDEFYSGIDNIHPLAYDINLLV